MKLQLPTMIWHISPITLHSRRFASAARPRIAGRGPRNRKRARQPSPELRQLLALPRPADPERVAEVIDRLASASGRTATPPGSSDRLLPRSTTVQILLDLQYRPDLATAILEHRYHRSGGIDAGLLNAALRACRTSRGAASRGELDRQLPPADQVACELLRRAQTSFGVDPDTRCFNTALAACVDVARGRGRGRGGEKGEGRGGGKEPCEPPWQQALSLLDEMVEAGVAPDTVSYTTAISACAAAGHLEAAREVYKAMREAGVVPNRPTYASLLKACARNKRWREALELLEEMEAAGKEDPDLVPDTIIYNGVIDACRAGNRSKEAERVFRRMRQQQQQQQSLPAPDREDAQGGGHHRGGKNNFRSGFTVLGAEIQHVNGILDAVVDMEDPFEPTPLTCMAPPLAGMPGWCVGRAGWPRRCVGRRLGGRARDFASL